MNTITSARQPCIWPGDGSKSASLWLRYRVQTPPLHHWSLYWASPAFAGLFDTPRAQNQFAHLNQQGVNRHFIAIWSVSSLIWFAFGRQRCHPSISVGVDFFELSFMRCFRIISDRKLLFEPVKASYIENLQSNYFAFAMIMLQAMLQQGTPNNSY